MKDSSQITNKGCGIIETKITRVDEGSDDYFVTYDRWTFGLSKSYGVVPKVGDKITVFTIRLTEVRGIAINGVELYYKSDEQLEKERTEWLENYKQEKQKRYEKNLKQMDEDYESLPQVFKDRIDKFRSNNPNFRMDYEDYELFCCKEALKIALQLKTVDAIRNFKELPWEAQLALVAVDEGHSGNTFGCACALAIAYVESPEYIACMHGALSPLVGSVEYGEYSKEELNGNESVS